VQCVNYGLGAGSECGDCALGVVKWQRFVFGVDNDVAFKAKENWPLERCRSHSSSDEANFVYPRRFDNPLLELSFLEEFQKTGVRFARVAAFSGAFVAISFFSLMYWFEGRDNNQVIRQIIRIFLFLFLLVMGLGLTRISIKPGWQYNFVVGVPAAVACVVVAALGFLPTEVGLPRSGRLAVAMTLTCFLIYAFTRLPVLISGTICLSASFIAILAGLGNGDDFTAAIAVYLVTVNISGYILACSIERRERELFRKNLVLADAGRKAANDALSLSKANAAKSALLAAVNHDLRQPMASVSLYLEQLREVIGPNRGPSDCVSGINDCIEAIEDTVTRLSTLELLGGDARQVCTACNLLPILRRLESVYRQKALMLGVKFQVRVAPAERLIANTVSARLWDIVSNIVSNAIKFSSVSPGPVVLVVVRGCRDKIRITIIDNGPGIPRDLHNRIFDEYFQALPRASGGDDGVGLGLFIVKGLVGRLPGHSLRLRSKVGLGTRFDLFLPTLRIPGCEATISSSSLRSSGSLEDKFDEFGTARRESIRGLYILLVCTEAPQLDGVVGYLNDRGVLMEVSLDVKSACVMVRESERLFDLIFIVSSSLSIEDVRSLSEKIWRIEGCRIPVIRGFSDRCLVGEGVEVYNDGGYRLTRSDDTDFEFRVVKEIPCLQSVVVESTRLN
jgi:signal transduction histidine kinase